DILQVSSEVAGRIIELKVREHETVKAGDVMVRIDPDPYAMALTKAEAELDAMRAQVATLIASWHEADSELKEADSRLTFLDVQLNRQKQLAKSGVVATVKLEDAESNASQARERVAVMRQKLARVAAQIGGDPKQPVDMHPLVREKMALRDRAKLDLARTIITAPASGIVVNAKLLVGEHIKAATPLFALVADSQPWVEANFKETELTNVRPGQSATVTLDIYPDIVWTATVDTISPATGAEFALLPPQNASGNWVKVVQRLPVRLKLVPVAGRPPLRAGMTATVKVDTEQKRRLAQLIGWATAEAKTSPAPAASK
ncbi:MAG TPA: HlyD family secretion protein, partial [Hyphomicrobiaceae bacterium]|nr:HlyD family secretion protein [Hyphomicrobiaceae bacterium]